MDKINVLILGSGGREHAIAWKLSKSNYLNKLYVAPGNSGTNLVAQNVDINPNDFLTIGNFVNNNDINLIVVGPEEPLVNGIVDFFTDNSSYNNVKIIGPDKKAARLEGSKDFAKNFMQKYNIPNARYKSFTSDELNEANAFLDSLKAPYVIKADGLAAGKGVEITSDINEAKKIASQMLIDKKFGKASSTIVIEEFLNGIELSVFVITDGNNYVLLPEAKDYKKIFENDKGENTGGMGAVSPVYFFEGEFKNKVIKKIIEPTIEGIRKEKMNYKGFIFFGLIKVDNNPYVIEYNVRLGDPETQAVLPRIDEDLLYLLYKTAENKLENRNIKIKTDYAVSAVAVSGGYPHSYEKNKVISGNLISKTDSELIFHAGVYKENDLYKTNGGRVLSLTVIEKNIERARIRLYDELEKINFEKIYYRKDIGKDLINN